MQGRFTRCLAGSMLLLAAGAAHAYVGPGLGIGVLGAIIGLLTAILLAVIGTVWYPVKRLLRALSRSPNSADAGVAVGAEEETVHDSGENSRS